MRGRPIRTGRSGGPQNKAIALAQAVLAGEAERLGLADGELPFLEEDSGRMAAYNGRSWQEISNAALRAIVFSYADPDASTSRQRTEAIDWLRARCHRSRHEWGRVEDHEVPVANGVVDLLTMRLRAHRASDYLESVIPWPFEPRATSPALQAYLSSCFGDGGDERHDALRAFAGYVVLPHARLKKALLLHGPGDTGKTQFVLLLKALAGRDATCSLSVDEMDDPVARSVLVGKRLNVLTELPAEAMIRDGGFKTLVSTEDPVQINPKYATPFMYSPIAKHVIATNTLPRVNDRTDATFSRLYIVPFDRVIPKGEQDVGLQSKFLAEMPGILAWALQGAADLVKRGGRFPAVVAADERMQQMREEANPVTGFVQQMMVAETGAATPVNEITRAFNGWHGGKKLDIRQLARLLRAAFGDDAVAKAWCPAVSITATSLRGYRMRTGSEAADADGRGDWSSTRPPDEPQP